MTDDTEIPVTIPRGPTGIPDLQLLVRVCGGYDKIRPVDWRAFDQAMAQWQTRYRFRLPERNNPQSQR